MKEEKKGRNLKARKTTTKKSLSITPLNYFYWSIKCSISRRKILEQTPQTSLPLLPSAPVSLFPLSVCVSHTCQWSANCRVPTVSDFWFRLSDLCGMFPGCPLRVTPASLPASVCDSTFCIIFEHFRAKRCQFVGPPQKKRGAPHDNCLKWRRFSFHTFQFNLGKSRHTAAAVSIEKCAGKSTTKMIYSRWILGKGLLLFILSDFIKIYHLFYNIIVENIFYI